MTITSREAARLGVDPRPAGSSPGRPKGVASRPSTKGRDTNAAAVGRESPAPTSPRRRASAASGSELHPRAPIVPRPEREATDPKALLDVFIPGRVTNPMNGSLSRAHWSKKSRWSRGWRDKAGLMIGIACIARPDIDARSPKHVTFTLSVWNLMDSDGLGPACKGVRDALVDALVVDSDGPKAPHIWQYEQQVDRKRPGVRIVVEARGLSLLSSASGDRAKSGVAARRKAKA